MFYRYWIWWAFWEGHRLCGAAETSAYPGGVILKSHYYVIMPNVIILSMIQDLYTILAEQHTTNLKPPFHYFSYNNKKSHEENNMFSLISIFTWKLNEHFYMWKLNFDMWNCIFTCQKLSLENLTCTLTGKTLKSCHIVSWYEILHPHVVTFI